MNTTDKKEIDLLEIGQKIWQKKGFVGKISLIGLIVGIIIAFSIPKEYTTHIILAPEAKSSSGSGNVGTLAAMAGINLQQPSDDAISPELYPNIVRSTPFLIGLLDIQVEDKNANIDTDIYTYLQDNQKSAWWNYIMRVPSKLLGLFSSKDNSSIVADTINSNITNLTPAQSNVINNLESRINISVDKKTGVITLTSRMQSPEISAYTADTISKYLQSYIIKYRTQKARQDHDYTEKLYNEAKNEYYKAQQAYTTYSDRNLDIVSASYGSTKERLQNEATLAYNVYNQMAQQLQMAKVKVQDTTPVYTVIQPAVIPLIPEAPKKKMIVIGLFLVAFLGACSWIIIKEYLLSNN